MAGCSQDWFDNLSAWHDGEMSPDDGRRVEEHLAGCAPCRRAAAIFGGVRDDLRASADSSVPARVRERAEGALARHAPRTSKWRRRSGLAAVVFAAAASLFFVFQRPSTLAPSLQDELVSHHWNGFTRERPCDFESPDPAAVSAWLESQLGYEVSVSIPEGARLLGARLCRITESRTAAVMYRTEDSSALTVFVPPQSSRAASMARSFAGDGLRCTTGPLGAAICISNEGQPMLAVAESQPSRLASALSSP